MVLAGDCKQMAKCVAFWRSRVFFLKIINLNVFIILNYNYFEYY